MSQIREIMSSDVVSIGSAATIQQAAELMQRHDIGALPVCDSGRVVGMVTDRDIAVRALASRRAPQDPVSRIATAGVEWCYDDEDVDTVQRRMAEAQVRRVPVVNRRREMVGAMSIGDIATRCAGVQRERLTNTLEDISQRRIRAG